MKNMLLVFTLVAVLVMPAISAAAEESEANVSVRVNAPEFVSGAFEVTIDIEDVADLDSGQFDLSFDPDVVSVVDVEPGNIGGTEVPIDMWRLMEGGRARVPFNLPGVDGVGGSGHIATIIFEAVGSQGDASAINLSDGLLVDVEALKIPTNWFGTNVTIGTAPAASDEAPPPTKSPTIVAASAPEPTATSIETPLLESESKPSASTARAQDAPAAIVPSASSEKDELQDVLTTHNFITIYSFIGLLAFIYAFTLLR